MFTWAWERYQTSQQLFRIWQKLRVEAKSFAEASRGLVEQIFPFLLYLKVVFLCWAVNNEGSWHYTCRGVGGILKERWEPHRTSATGIKGPRKSRTLVQYESLFSRQKSVLVWGEAVAHSISLCVPLVLSKGHAGLAFKSSWVCVSDVCIRKSG